MENFIASTKHKPIKITKFGNEPFLKKVEGSKIDTKRDQEWKKIFISSTLSKLACSSLLRIFFLIHKND